MEIKRKFELLATTNRRYTIRQSPSVKQINCEICNGATLTTEQATVFLGVKQRQIFQIIEIDVVHFAEIETGVVMVCLTSLTEFLEMEKSLTI